MNQIQIPPRWIWATLEDVATITTGNPAPQDKEYFVDGIYPFIRVHDMGNLGSDIYIHKTRDKINEKAIDKLKLFPIGSVLFTKSGMSLLLNQRAILGKDMYVVSHIGIAIPTNRVLSKFLYYWFNTIDFKTLSHATSLPSLQISKVKKIQFPLPPMEIQQKIVHKLDHILSQLEEKKKEVYKILETNRTKNLGIHLKNKILDQAFKGNLTERNLNYESVEELLNRIGTKNDLKVDENSNSIKPPHDIPIGWRWVRIQQVCKGIVPGRYKPSDFGGDIPWITLPDVDDFYVMASKKNLAVSKEEAKRVNMKIFPENTVLMSCVGDVGRICITKSSVVPNQQFHGFFPYDKIAPEYIAFALLSETNQIKNAVTTTTLPYLNKTKCNTLLIPLAPLEEQKRIVDKVNEKLQYVEILNQHLLQVNLYHISIRQHISELSKNILNAAFSGKLVI